MILDEGAPLIQRDRVLVRKGEDTQRGSHTGQKAMRSQGQGTPRTPSSREDLEEDEEDRPCRRPGFRLPASGPDTSVCGFNLPSLRCSRDGGSRKRTVPLLGAPARCRAVRERQGSRAGRRA